MGNRNMRRRRMFSSLIELHRSITALQAHFDSSLGYIPFNTLDLYGSSLAENIMEIGLLHPIVVNQIRELISGLRRIEAFTAMAKVRSQHIL
jgi:hypothetical protein